MLNWGMAVRLAKPQVIFQALPSSSSPANDPRILELDGFSLDEETVSQEFRFLSDSRDPLRAFEQESDMINQRSSV